MEKLELLKESAEIIEAMALVLGHAEDKLNFPTKKHLIQNILQIQDLTVDD